MSADPLVDIDEDDLDEDELDLIRASFEAAQRDGRLNGMNWSAYLCSHVSCGVDPCAPGTMGSTPNGGDGNADPASEVTGAPAATPPSGLTMVPTGDLLGLQEDDDDKNDGGGGGGGGGEEEVSVPPPVVVVSTNDDEAVSGAALPTLTPEPVAAPTLVATPNVPGRHIVSHEMRTSLGAAHDADAAHFEEIEIGEPEAAPHPAQSIVAQLLGATASAHTTTYRPVDFAKCLGVVAECSRSHFRLARGLRTLHGLRSFTAELRSVVQGLDDLDNLDELHSPFVEDNVAVLDGERLSAMKHEEAVTFMDAATELADSVNGSDTTDELVRQALLGTLSSMKVEALLDPFVTTADKAWGNYIRDIVESQPSALTAQVAGDALYTRTFNAFHPIITELFDTTFKTDFIDLVPKYESIHAMAIVALQLSATTLRGKTGGADFKEYLRDEYKRITVIPEDGDAAVSARIGAPANIPAAELAKSVTLRGKVKTVLQILMNRGRKGTNFSEMRRIAGDDMTLVLGPFIKRRTKSAVGDKAYAKDLAALFVTGLAGIVILRHLYYMAESISDLEAHRKAYDPAITDATLRAFDGITV